MISKKALGWIIAIVVILVAAGVWVGMSFVGNMSGGPSAYSAVYLVTGDMYFGKLSWFPRPHLTNVWLLQRTTNAQNQAQLGLVPFTSSFWGPMNEIYLNPKQIVFWTSLKADGQVAKALESSQAIAAGQNTGLPPTGNQLPPPAPVNATSSK